MAQTAIDFSTEQAAYTAALQASAKIVQSSLLDFLQLEDTGVSLMIESSRFGRVEIDPETVVEFPDGLIGLGGSRYALLAAEPDSPFLWLHSIEDPVAGAAGDRSRTASSRRSRFSSRTRTPSASGSTTSPP